MSMRVTRSPRPSSASATPAPLISDTSRSEDQPPISTATWRAPLSPSGEREEPRSGEGRGEVEALLIAPVARDGLPLSPTMRRSPCPPDRAGPRGARPTCASPEGEREIFADTLDFPLQPHSGMLEHPPPHFLAERLD